MATEVYLGEPPAHVKKWIRKHHKQVLYKLEGGTEWQEYEPTANDI